MLQARSRGRRLHVVHAVCHQPVKHLDECQYLRSTAMSHWQSAERFPPRALGTRLATMDAQPGKHPNYWVQDEGEQKLCGIRWMQEEPLHTVNMAQNSTLNSSRKMVIARHVSMMAWLMRSLMRSHLRLPQGTQKHLHGATSL